MTWITHVKNFDQPNSNSFKCLDIIANSVKLISMYQSISVLLSVSEGWEWVWRGLKIGLKYRRNLFYKDEGMSSVLS